MSASRIPRSIAEARTRAAYNWPHLRDRAAAVWRYTGVAVITGGIVGGLCAAGVWAWMELTA